MKSERSRMCDISPKVKQKVFERDNGLCIICGNYGSPNAHYISRYNGGLGIEENIVTLCQECHNTYDNGNYLRRLAYKEIISSYLMSHYPEWDEGKLKFKHWSERK